MISRKILPFLICCCPIYASAQAVTLYGIMEEGLIVAKGKHSAAVVEMRSGFDQGSRWGLKGTEDLGSGYQVGFILEQGFSADTGAAGAADKAFNRETLIQVNGGFGRVSFGLTGALGSGAQTHNILTGWAFSTGYLMSGWNSMSVKTVRVDNSIGYVSPSFSGLNLYALYSNGVGGDEEKWSYNGHYYGLGLKYEANNIKSSLILDARDFKPEHHQRDLVVNYGLEVTTGNWTPMFGYQWYNKDGGLNTHMFGLSAKGNVLSGDLRIGVRYLFGKDRAAEANKENKVNLFNIGAAYIYPLSKRTALKGYVGYVHSGKKWSSEKDYLYNGYAAVVGIRTSF